MEIQIGKLSQFLVEGALLFAIIFLIYPLSQASSIPIVSLPQPALSSFKINSTTQTYTNGGGCTFTVSIRTSCSSPYLTEDQISLSFGDAYGNQVYAPRLDDPSSRTFERCSSDTYEIKGPCTYDICYLYVYRSGYDGWIPYDITVSGYYTRPVTFRYNVPIPSNIWYGFDYCSGGGRSGGGTTIKAGWVWSLLSVFMTFWYTVVGQVQHWLA
ncbi:unnamed protein product [Cuscuta epithymum]|uniref:Uncharacterized protein n=1 Tax=Cuscuta epithymum TaxID=186058 RepID=A0AAV0CF31_9ASTE|nr:unnamed protein product [Cuscuta epithymum]